MDHGERRDRQEIGRRIGFDLVLHGRGSADLALPAPIREGIAHARGRDLASRAPDRYVAKWLQVRTNAFRRDRVVDDGVTAAFLRDIDVLRCPVTRCVLTHGTLRSTDWSIDRLNNDGAYAPGNLAVISKAVNAAKGDRSFDDVLDRSRDHRPTGGLAPAEWLRLAVLMLGPCHADHPRLAPLLPLVAPLPAHTPRPIGQVVQHVFTTNMARQADRNRIVRAFRRVSSTALPSLRLERFVDCLHRASKRVDDRHDAWLDPAVMESFVTWRRTLDASAWTQAGQIAGDLAGGHRTSLETVRAWCLEQRGYAS